MTSYPPNQPGGQPPAPGSWAAAAQAQQPSAPAGGYGAPAASSTGLGQLDVRASQVGWLVPLGALLAVIGAATPWFKPSAALAKGAEHGAINFPNLYSWKDGKIGLVAPLILVVLSIGVVALMRGKVMSRFNRGNRHPVASAGISAIIAGGIALVCVVVAWFMLPGQLEYKTGGQDYKGWTQIKNAAHAAGVNSISLSHGAKIGYWLTLVGGVLALVAGVLLLLDGRRQQKAMPPVPVATYGAAPSAGYAAPGYGSTPGYSTTPVYGSTPGYSTTPNYGGAPNYGGPGYPAPDPTTPGAQPPPPPTYP